MDLRTISPVTASASAVNVTQCGKFTAWVAAWTGFASKASLTSKPACSRPSDRPPAPQNASTATGRDIISPRSYANEEPQHTRQLQTDEQGRADFDLHLPDNVTTWRARARAATAETQVGEGESELLVTKPLLVRPALPRFLRVGDEVTLRTLVTNRTTAALNVIVTIRTDGVALDRKGARSARIEPGRTSVFGWPARAVDEGTATVRFRATVAGGGGDAVELRLPVHLDVTPETTATGGVVEDAPAVEAVYLPDYVITGQGSLEISLQASLVGALDAELGHFLPPHSWESNVRVASRIVAMVAVQRANASGLTDAHALQLQSDIQTLVRSGRYDGWGWCQTCYTASPWITAWVLIALGEARDAGYSVPDYQYSQAARLVMDYLSRETDIADPPDPNQHAFLLYALAKAAAQGGDVAGLVGEQADAMQAILDEHRAGLTGWGRAYLVLGLLASGHEADHASVRTLLNDLTANTIASANGNHWEDAPRRGSMHNGSVRTTALVLRALTAADPRHPLIEETARWLVYARGADRWKTSVERAQGMAALGAFAANSRAKPAASSTTRCCSTPAGCSTATSTCRAVTTKTAPRSRSPISPWARSAACSSSATRVARGGCTTPSICAT